MPSSDILGTALSGLSAAQSGLRAVANNIANAQTPGYARARADYVPNVAGGVGGGVRALELVRIADRFLERSVYAGRGEAARSEARAAYLDRVSGFLGEPGKPGGLPARLDAIQTAAINLQSIGPIGQGRAELVGRINDALQDTGRIAAEIEVVRADVDDEIGRAVPRINNLLLRIRDLNEDVARATALGRSTSGIADARAAALGELGDLIGVDAREGADGRIAIETKGGQVLLDRRARALLPQGVAAASLTHPPIGIALVDPETGATVPTAETLDLQSAGGRIAGLAELRDLMLPGFTEQVKDIGAALAFAVNGAAAQAMASPPPDRLEGRNTGLVAGDRLGFAGRTVVAALDARGAVLGRVELDLASLSTIDDAVAAINAGLAGAATASFANGRLEIAAAGAARGMAVGDPPGQASDRAGASFAHFFGFNDVVTGLPGTLMPSGLSPADAHGAGAGQSIALAMRDRSGRITARWTLDPAAAGPAVGDLVAALNTSPLAAGGRFALTPRGKLAFEPTPGNTGMAPIVVADTTDRAGTGVPLGALLGLGGGGAAAIAAGMEVDRRLAADPLRLPVARFDATAPPGRIGVATGDFGGTGGYIDALIATSGFGPSGGALDRFTAEVLGGIGAAAQAANERRDDFGARAQEAQARRDSLSGVNVDEEMAQMVLLQNSYAASARVLAAAREMTDTLLAIIR